MGPIADFPWDRASEYMGAMVQNPDNLGSIKDHTELAAKLKENKVVFTIAADILSLNLVKPPGDMGADIAIGSA